MNEKPDEKFRRVAAKRVERVLHEIQLIGNLGSRTHYDYSQEQVDRIFNALEEEIKSARSRFSVKRAKRFVL